MPDRSGDQRFSAVEKTGDAERLAHTVKGVAGNVGAGQLQEAAARLEYAIKEGETDTYEEKISAFGQSAEGCCSGSGGAGEEENEVPASEKAGPEATRMNWQPHWKSYFPI